MIAALTPIRQTNNKMRAADATQLLAAATVKLDQGDFSPTVLVDRNVTIAASNDSTVANAPTLDFDGQLALILVSTLSSHKLYTNMLLQCNAGPQPHQQRRFGNACL